MNNQTNESIAKRSSFQQASLDQGTKRRRKTSPLLDEVSNTNDSAEFSIFQEKSEPGSFTHHHQQQ